MTTDSFEYKAGSMSSVVNGRPGVLNLDEAQGIVECFVSGIGNKDSVGDIVHSGAFTKSLMRRKPRVVWGHNWNDPIGKVLEIYEVPSTDPRLPLKMKMAGIGGLFARVQFNLGSEKGREAFANVAFFGEEQEWSIGYKTLRAQFDQKSQANMIYELELYEVSPVLHGANQLTGTISVKGGMPGSVVMEQMPTPMGERPAPSMMTMIEKELQKLMRNRVSVTEVDEEDGMISFEKEEENGETDSYKCRFSRGDHGSYMFGAPERIVVIAKPTMHSPSMPGGAMPSVDPQRVVRPSQMPAIPIAIKPGPNGMMAVPLPVMRYEGQEQKPINENDLDQEESDLRDALLKIVKRHGKLNEDSDGIWAAYTPAARNHVAGIGVKCSNCVFYQKDNTCKIVDMPIEPEGKCRFAVIPNGVVKGDFASKKQYEFETEDNEDEYVSDFEFKYPGELFVAALRGTVGRKRRKKRKFKHLAEFGTYEDQSEIGKPYYLPVLTDQIFHVKQALDPIFEYHKVETYVDPEGIVMTDGVSYELIDAIDTALDNLKKKDLIPEGLSVKASAYRLGRAIGNRIDNRPGLGGARSARRFFSTPNAQSFDPRTAIDRNLNGVVGEGIFLRGVSLEQPDPTPNGPGSINNPKVPGVKPDINAIDAPGTEAVPDAKLNTEKITPSKRVVEKKPTVQPKVGKATPVSSAKKNAQAKNNEYLKYLTKKDNQKTLEERIKFDGAYNSITKSGTFSSGKDQNGLKNGDIVDTGTEEGRAIIEAYYDKMQEEIIKMLESAVNNPTEFKWDLPWREGEHSPRNPTKRNEALKGRAYQGTNRSLLNSIAVNRGYETNKWAGITQWKKMGGKASPNARPVNVLVPIAGSDPRKYKVEEVYNVADIDGLKPEMYKPEIDLENMSPKARAKNAEAVVKEIAPRIRENQVGGAFFSPSQDFINMPFFDSFETAEGYYATLLHEITHWTGHPSRNDRDQQSKFGSKKYAYEELIAEIGSAMLLGFIGISPEVRKDHIGYLSSWLEKIKTDKSSLRRAFAEAQQAVDYLLNKSKTLRRLSGMEDNERKSKKSVRDSVPISMLEGFEDAPSVPTTQTISGPFEDIDLINVTDEIAFPTLGAVPFYDKENDLLDTSDLPSSDYLDRYGKPTPEERRFSDFPSVFSSGGNPLTISGKFASGNEPLKPSKKDSKVPDVTVYEDTFDMKTLLDLPLPPTDEQRDIISLAVAQVYRGAPFTAATNAAAGSGKSSTLKMVAAAIKNEFETQFLFDRFEEDPKELSKLLSQKLDSLIKRYSEAALSGLSPEDQKELAKLVASKPTSESSARKTNLKLAEEIRNLKSRVDELRPESVRGKPASLYYVLFGKEAKTEALGQYGSNTGIATSTQLSYWTMRMGGAASPGTLLNNPEQWPKKMELSLVESRPRTDKQQQIKTPGYDPVTRQHESRDVITTGKTPDLSELGYFVMDKSIDLVRFLGEMEQYKSSSPIAQNIDFPRFTQGAPSNDENAALQMFEDMYKSIVDQDYDQAKKLAEDINKIYNVDVMDSVDTAKNAAANNSKIPLVKIKTAIDKKSKKLQADFAKVRDSDTISIKGVPTRAGMSYLTKDEYADFILKAVKRFMLSGDIEVTEKIFEPTHRERDREVGELFQKKKNDAKTSIVDETEVMNGIKRESPEEFNRMLELAKYVIDEMMDGNGSVIPNQSDLPKVVLMSRASLKSAPGLVGHDKSLDFKEKVRNPAEVRVEENDIVFVNPENGLHYKEKPGTKDAERLWTEDEGEPYLVTKTKQSKVDLKKIYASEESPLNLFMIDEAQDLNEVWAAIMKNDRENVSILAVGDERQAIMGFAGSQNIMKAIEPEFEPKLTKTYRFGNTLGLLATILLSEQNIRVARFDDEDSRPPKFVQGVADTSALEMLDRMVDSLEINNDSQAATLAESIKKLYGVDFTQQISAMAGLKSAGKKIAITKIKRDVDNIKPELKNKLDTKIVEPAIEIMRGQIPTMLLQRGKAGLIGEASGNYGNLFEDMLIFLGGKPKDVDLMSKQDLSEEEFKENLIPISPTIKPSIALTPNAYAESLDFFKHLAWIDTNDKFPGRRKPKRSGIGNVWTKKQVLEQLRKAENQTFASLYNYMQQERLFPSDMVRMFQTTEVKQADGSTVTVKPRFIALRDSLNFGKMEMLSEPPDGDSETDVAKSLANYLTGGKGSRETFGFVSKIEVLAPAQDGTKNAVYFTLEADFKDPNIFNENDFTTIVETIPGQDSPRVRVVSKWNKAKKAEPKFETIAEYDESSLPDEESRIKELTSLAMQRMRHALVHGAAPRNSDPREARYAKAADDFRWTGRLILTGHGVDTARPLSVDPATGEAKRNDSGDGIYLTDIQRLLPDLKIKYTKSRNVGVLKAAGSDRRDYDGVVFDANGDVDRAVEIINKVGDSIRKSARSRGGDITIQTATTAKGAESSYVFVASDFRRPSVNPDQEILEQTFGAPSPAVMEEGNLQHVAITRAKNRIAMAPEFFESWFAPTPERQEALDHIRQKIKEGKFPPELEEAFSALDPENLPPYYAAISDWVAGGRDPAKQPDIDAFNYLAMDDDELRKIAEENDIPKVSVENFIRRRQEKVQELEEAAGGARVGNDDALREMRKDLRSAISGDAFSVQDGMQEEDETDLVQDDEELDVDENSILDEMDEAALEGTDRDAGGDIEDVDPDDADFNDAGDASGTFSSGASNETTKPKTTRVKGRPDVSRFGRRLRRYEDGKGIRRQLSALDLSGSRWDVSQSFEALDYAMQFWDGFRKTGIALDMPVDAKLSIDERKARIPLAIEAVGKKMLESGVVRVGNLRENRATDDHSSDTWMLSVDKLVDALRIPKTWTVQRDVSRGTVFVDPDDPDGKETVDAPMSTNWSTSEPITKAKLAKLLGLRAGPQLNALTKQDAALSFNTVKYLIAEIGKSPDFNGWRLFSPVSDEQAKELGLRGAERLAEDLGRAAMRERFIIETFGEDAYPFWYNKLKKPDPEENFDDVFQLSQTELPETAGEMITPAQYADLYENSPVSRFIAEGKFQNAPNSRDDSEVELSLLLSLFPDIDGDVSWNSTDSEEMDELKVYLNAPSAKGEKTRRTDFPLAPLLEQLGIENNSEWPSQLKEVLQSDPSFGQPFLQEQIRNSGVESDLYKAPNVGLGPDAKKSWEKDGVPTAYVAEMVRVGLIENAASIWRTNNAGERFDQELLANKPAVYEALTQFIDKSFPDSSLNSLATRQQIVNNTDVATTLKNAAERRGRNFSKGLGEFPRYSANGLQEIVDEFNKIFGTNHTIDDLFSAEQLRNAQRVLNEGTTTYGKNKPRKGTRKITSNTVNAK